MFKQKIATIFWVAFLSMFLSACTTYSKVHIDPQTKEKAAKLQTEGMLFFTKDRKIVLTDPEGNVVKRCSKTKDKGKGKKCGSIQNPKPMPLSAIKWSYNPCVYTFFIDGDRYDIEYAC